jgi:hypothetical protein
MKSIINCRGIELDNFVIPPFTFNHGEMLRLWIQILPRDGYELCKKLIYIFNKSILQKGIDVNEKVEFVDVIKENKLQKWISPLTVENYLRKNIGLKNIEIEETLKEFGIEPKQWIKKIDHYTQKALTISALFKKTNCLSFDYYGLGALPEIEITDLIIKEINSGKSAISFDNLFYLTENELSDKIKG